MRKLDGSVINKDLDNAETTETSRLLAALDDVLDQSTVMRDIVDKYERLHRIESIAGPSIRTRILREEIESMEREFSFERYQQRL
jgi:hypothetical protein